MIEIIDSQTEDIVIGNKIIRPWRTCKNMNLTPAHPRNFKTEKSTVWSFPNRGDWASHTSQYRGNWSPRVVRNIIELYSKPGDTVLDPMVGGGTTPVECMLLGRNSLSSDINPRAISITKDRLDLPISMTCGLKLTSHRTFVGDIRDLNLIEDSSVDLVATHPPYANMIKYAASVDGDLSQIEDYDVFFREFGRGIAELYRVVKPCGYCAILIGNTHKRTHYVPISYSLSSTGPDVK